ncbi:MAG: reverse transcriptase domain-containing protein [Stellaceae bacterium]
MWPLSLLRRPTVAPGSSVTLARLARLAHLREGWERVRRNRGGPGGDGVSIGRFAVALEARLARLSRELLTDRYRPGPLRRVAIKKPDGGTRELAIPCVRDRVVQTALMLLLDRRFDAAMAGASFGYRAGRGVDGALARVEDSLRVGGGWVVDLDLAKFFDSVPHDALIAGLLAGGVEPRIGRLVRLWLDGFSATGRGLPQGAPVSPILANLYLDSLDRRLAQGDHRLVRYADDLVLICPTQRAAGQALRRIRRALRRRGLAVNESKTRIVGPGGTLRFLGREIPIAPAPEGR